MMEIFTHQTETSTLWGFFHTQKTSENTLMSLRDELKPVRTGNKSRIEMWLETQPEAFSKEFNELLHDNTVGHTQLHVLSQKYGCPVKIGRFTEWRKSVWASKTS
jgi:hypothetical protein